MQMIALSAEVAKVEVDAVKAVEESTDPKRQQRHASTQISSFLPMIVAGW